MKALAVAAACGLFLATSAHADEPFVLDDAAMDSVSAAGGVVSFSDIAKNVNLTTNIAFNKAVDVFANIDLNGDAAIAEAASDASGYVYQLAETFVAAQVTPGLATSYSEASAFGLNPMGNGGNGGNGENGG